MHSCSACMQGASWTRPLWCNEHSTGRCLFARGELEEAEGPPLLSFRKRRVEKGWLTLIVITVIIAV